jgi:hypothetical protein
VTDRPYPHFLEAGNRHELFDDMLMGKVSENRYMPTISMFYGIVVSMYFLDNRRHARPHVHARFQSDEVVVSIPDGDVLEGHLPPAKLRLLLAWVEIHRDELVADWDLAVNGQQPFKIDPLR